jgi:SnoaL-like domain
LIKLSQDEVAATVMITTLITRWATELDRNNGLTLAPLIAEDCSYTNRGIPRHSPAEVIQFYRDRLDELNRTPAGPPTQRHVITNLLMEFPEDGKASVDFLLTYYLSSQKPPVTDMDGPTAIADCHMDCSRDANGCWRIASFDSVQNFIRGSS